MKSVDRSWRLEQVHAQCSAVASRVASGADKPIEECKAVVFQVIYTWFMDRLYTYINRNYLALEKVVGKEAL
jgi:hypothetical protein